MTDKVKQTAPNSVRHLDNAIHRMAADDRAYVNIRSIVANAIVGQLMPSGVVKGGTSLKLRFGDALTRFTTDLDTARSVGMEEFRQGLEEALSQGWCGFAGNVELQSQAHPKDVPAAYVMQPLAVKLRYLGKPWCTVAMEVGHDEIGDADEVELVVPREANFYLEQLGFPALDAVPCMSLPFQVAQKLHGASEPRSMRAHDLIDLQIIMTSDVDLTRTRRICERLFAYRKQQAWPPVIQVGENWESLYSTQREGLEVIKDVASAVAWANDLIKTIASAE